MNTMDSEIRIVLVGGGSGGHFYPLMSIAEKLRAHPLCPALFYMGPDTYDTAALKKADISFIYCPAGKRRKYASPLNFFDIFKTLWGTLVALVELYKLYPDVIVSKGSYTSVPVILAGAFFNIPIVIHESDTQLGSANKLASHFARHIAVSFEEILPFLKRKKNVTLTGIPIREELLMPANENVREALGISNSLPIILILGGSQGAERINQLVLDSLDELLPTYNIIHQTGKNNFDITVLSARELIHETELLTRYRPVAFFEDAQVLNDVYHAATIIISRAGTGTIYEISIHGKPSILIPIPELISHDQKTNAYAYAHSGAATVLEETNLSDSLLTAEIDRIIKSVEVYLPMAEAAQNFAPRNASENIAKIIISLAQTH